MAYDRYDTERGWRGRQSDDRFRDRDPERDYGRRDERGFFERAGEEIRSWFGDDDDYDRRGRGDDGWRQRNRPLGEHRGESDRPGWGSALNWGRDDDRFSGSTRDRFDRDEDRGRRPMNWTGSNRDYRSSAPRGGDSDYRPFAGDYGRSGREMGRGDFDRESQWDRDPYRRTSFAGSSERSQHSDPHYHSWRSRQMDELDRDYDEYRRENQSRFESDFGSWRERRQQKRGLLGQVREHMEVLGSDEQHIGTVDRVAGDRIILTKSDGEAGGVHHSLPCTEIDRIDGERVILDISADKARERWRDESRDRALFEREDQGEAGPHMLDRSFSGTYR